MARSTEFPNVIPVLIALGEARMRAIGKKLEICLPSPASADQLAEILLRSVENPSRFGYGSLDSDTQTMGVTLGLGDGSTWTADGVPPEVQAERWPTHTPSYEDDAWNMFLLRRVRKRPPFRAPMLEVDHAAQWPELSTPNKWSGTSRQRQNAVAQALSQSLGEGYEALPAAKGALARVRHMALDLSIVAVCGGTFEMGLRKEEVRALTAYAKALGAPEALEHAKALRQDCRPVRRVDVRPFLLADRPLLGHQVAALSLPAESANAHGVARVDYETAPLIVERLEARLPSEAEWEWTARSTGRTWICGEEDPEDYARRLAACPLDVDVSPWGIYGLMWSEWVDDGWHPSYRKAPADALAWEPRTEPETVRGGLFELWPWQVTEGIACHVVARDRGGVGLHGVRPAWSLPAAPPG